MPAEAEGTRGGAVYLAFYPDVRHVVEIAAVLDVRVFEVDRRRIESVLNGLYADDRLDRARRSTQ